MFTTKTILSRSLLALALAAASSLALAGPTYHVAIDTSTLGTGSAYLDLGLADYADSGPVTATLSHFEGDFGAFSDLGGDSQGSVAPGDTVVLHTGGADWNDLFQEIVLGSQIRFDLSFDTADTGSSSSFAAILYNGDMSDYLGLPGSLVQIDLTPGAADVVSPDNAFASVSTDAAAVPEPSTLLSMMTGLSLLGFGLRRRAR